MVSWVTPKMQKVLLWSPSVQSTEMIRYGQFGMESHAIFMINYAIDINFILILIGLFLTKNVRKYIKVQ